MKNEERKNVVPDTNAGNGEKGLSRKNLLRIIRSILHGRENELTDLPSSPPPSAIDGLISKATGPSAPSELSENSENSENSDNLENLKTRQPDNSENSKSCCPFSTKRAIVESIQEIRRFAEEHKLAATVVKAMLTLLAEMALDTLKGKVSGKILEALLKAIRFDSVRDQAFDEGRKEGVNSRITAELFPPKEDDIPDMGGTRSIAESPASIFDIAKNSL